MKRIPVWRRPMMLLILLGALAGWATTGFAQDPAPRYQLPEGVYINLTEDFYRALREGADSGSTTYSTNPSEEYLRQIAVSAKFMVETNLRILKQQEEMVRLLQSIDSKRK